MQCALDTGQYVKNLVGLSLHYQVASENSIVQGLSELSLMICKEILGVRKFLIFLCHEPRNI